MTPGSRLPQPPAGYLDAATAEPLHPAAAAVLQQAAAEGWADPGRRYAAGRRARLLLETARESLAGFLGVSPAHLHVTPSAAVAGAAALHGVVGSRLAGGAAPRLLASAVEQSGLLAEAERLPADVTLVPVDPQGRVDPARFAAAVDPGAAAALLQQANHELGGLQPIDEVEAALAPTGVPLLVDATAGAGRYPVPAGAAAAWADPRAWGGPPGVGLLVLRQAATPLLAADRFSRIWPGPPDLPAVIAAAAAAEAVAAADPAAEDRRLHSLTERLRDALAAIPDTAVLGPAGDRLPHIVSVTFLYVGGEELLDALDRIGFACSSGSSCASDHLAVQPSHVLTAIGASTHGSLRISLPRGTAEADVDRLLAALPELIARLRSDAGAGGL